MAEPDTDKRPEGAETAPSKDATRDPAADLAKARASSRPAEAAAPAKHPSAPPVEAAQPKHPSSRPVEAAAPAKHPSAPPVEAAQPKQPSVRPDEATKGQPSSPPSSAPTEAQVAAAAAAAFAAVAVPATVEERTSIRERAAPSGRPSARSAGASADAGPLGAYEAIARSARLPDLAAIAQKIVGEAAAARRVGSWDLAAKVSAAADDAKLSRSDGDTPFGNVLKVLGSGPEGEAERALACALWAHAVAEARRDDEDRLSGDILWLATHTPFDATPLLDRALGEEADHLWAAIGDRIRRFDEGKGTALGRGEAILGCASLVGSESPAARKVAADLAPILKDRTLSRLLDPSRGAGASLGLAAPLRELRLEGEALPAPRGPIATALLGLTGILFVMHAVRLVARFALAYRKHAEITLSESGVRMKTRTEMLGRTLREREHVILRAGLVRVVREVRYPRAAFYAGLLALAIGSYVGVRAFADGVRAASPSLLLTGLLVITLGIAADFALGSLLPGSRGRIRLAFVPRTGAVLCVGDIDAQRADEALARTLAAK